MIKNNKGFTVVELLVSVVLLVIILVPTAVFFTDSFRVQNKSTQKSSVTRVGQYVMENLKNKEYLDLDIEVSGTGYGILEIDDFAKIIQRVGDQDGVENICSNIEKIHGEIEYNNTQYDVEIKLENVTKSDMSNVEVPERGLCTGDITIDASGDCSDRTSNISFCEKGETFLNPIDEKVYTANYPTIVLESDFVSDLVEGDVALLWLENAYYDDINGRQETVRIIKNFDNELNVYIEGNNVSIVKGQEGDGASAAKTRLTKLYVGGEVETEGQKKSSEVLFDANMIIVKKNDESIRDIFNFSFPVSYEF